MKKSVKFSECPAAFYLKIDCSNLEPDTDREEKKKTGAQKEQSKILDFMDLSSKELSVFPDCVYSQSLLLKFLYLQDNQLTSLPEDFFKRLQQLEYLDVRNNDITHLPYLHSHQRYKDLDSFILIYA